MQSYEGCLFIVLYDHHHRQYNINIILELLNAKSCICMVGPATPIYTSAAASIGISSIYYQVPLIS